MLTRPVSIGVRNCLAGVVSSHREAKNRVHQVMESSRIGLALLTLFAALESAKPNGFAQERPRVDFTELANAAGVEVVHVHVEEPVDPFRQVSGGAAAGDFDGDGWPDLYVIAGDGDRQYLFRNLGDGTFEDVAERAGVAFPGERLSGPVMADIDGDRRLDLFVGTVGFAIGREPRLLRNTGAGTFVEIAHGSGMFPPGPYTGASFGDYDGDGRLDLFTTHWSMPIDFFDLDHLWRNEGNGVFRGVTESMNLDVSIDSRTIGMPTYFGFTANFADVDNDGWPDLLLASDFGQSQIFLNESGSRFREVTNEVITDENGMGAAVGDYDNDGHLDWFVTSIYDPVGYPFPSWGDSGNRLYRNLGDGSFEDVTEQAGVRDGAWGWGACFADFDNDGWLDIFHVNGWHSSPPSPWLRTPARLFLSNRDGTFTEAASAAGIADRGEGRGVVCFDYDGDGDVDVFIANLTGPMRLYRNDTRNNHNFLQVELVGRPPNTQAIGARIRIRTASGREQIRELRAGSNFVSQDPVKAHFGLGDETEIAALEVAWPHHKGRTQVHGISANRVVVVFEVDGDANCDGAATAADAPAFLRAIAAPPSPRLCPGGDFDYDGIVDSYDLQVMIRQIFGGT